jgi:hypothetical protein
MKQLNKPNIQIQRKTLNRMLSAASFTGEEEGQAV